MLNRSIFSNPVDKLTNNIVFFKAYMKVVMVNQAYNRLSKTHGHIINCKLDSVVYAGVCV